MSTSQQTIITIHNARTAKLRSAIAEAAAAPHMASRAAPVGESLYTVFLQVHKECVHIDVLR